jgi:hypothetical protein
VGKVAIPSTAIAGALGGLVPSGNAVLPIFLLSSGACLLARAGRAVSSPNVTAYNQHMKRVSLILGVVLVCQLPALAQIRFSFGALGGVRLSRGAPEGYHDESRRYTLGPAIEVSFGEHLAAEVDVLYKRFGYSDFFALTSGLPDNIPVAYDSARGRSHSVEIPVLGKYYFGARSSPGRFFVATGYSFQRSWTTSTSEVLQTSPYATIESFNIPGSAPTEVGAAFGAGWARKKGPLTFQPAFRYTHWGARFDAASRNQLEILLGLWF